MKTKEQKREEAIKANELLKTDKKEYDISKSDHIIMRFI
jgi:hypothetical protein